MYTVCFQGAIHTAAGFLDVEVVYFQAAAAPRLYFTSTLFDNWFLFFFVLAF